MVKEVADIALQNCRSIGGPVVMRAKCFRYLEHVGVGEDFDVGYRSASEMESWKMRDPISDPLLIKEFETQINIEIDQAVNFALESPFPQRETLLQNVL